MKQYIGLMIGATLLSISAFASKDRGGGDLCENRIQTIREDLKAWIGKNGHKDLKLPAHLTADKYASSMLAKIASAKIRCVNKGDRGYPVTVDGTPKECRFDLGRNRALITCDTEKFQSRSESEQYVLVHHEYAGLAGVELPNGDSSTYALSNQISGFLIDHIVKKLAVKPTPIPAPQRPQVHKWRQLDGAEGVHATRLLKDALDRSRHFSNCQISYVGPSQNSRTQTCGGESYYESNARINFVKQGIEDDFSLAIRVGEFDCGKNTSDESGVFLFQEEEGLPIYRQYYKKVLKEGHFGEGRIFTDDVYVDFSLNEDSTAIEHISFTTSRPIVVNSGTFGSPVWTTETLVTKKYECSKRE